MGLIRKLMILNIILTISVVGILSGLFFVFSAKVEASYNISPTIKQVKTADNPAVYYLDHARGKKKVYINEAAFLSYGNKWSDIKIVNQNELAEWSNINLVKSASSPAIYYINGGEKAHIVNEAEFLRLGFRWGDIVMVSETDLAAYSLTDFRVGGGPNNVIGNHRLIIEIDRTTPIGTTLPVNTKDNLVGVFNFKAEGELVEIRSLAFTLDGIFDTQVLDKIYLANASGLAYEIPVSIRGRKATFYFRSAPLIIQPGPGAKIKIFVEFANYQDVLNNTFQVSITTPSDIETETRISGSFPVKASIFRLIDGSNLLGRVIAEEKLINDDEVIIGDSGQVLNRFTIYETSNKEDLIIKEISFINTGNAESSDLSNFKLRDKRNRFIASINEMTDDGVIIFKPNNHRITKGDDETFTVIGDIDSGEGRTINLDFKEIKVAGDSYGFNLRPGYLNISELITIKRELLAVIAEDLESNRSVFSEQKGVIISTFQVRNNNQKINLESLDFSLEKGSNTPDLAKTVYLVNYGTGEVYGSFSGDGFSNGSVRVDLLSLDLNPRKTLTLTLITDIPREVRNGDSYRITLNRINYRVENGIFYHDEVNVAGTRLIVSKANIYVYPNNEINEFSYTKGEKKIKIASFIVEAAAGKDTVIDSLTFSRGNTSGIISFTNGFSNLKVYIGSKRSRNVIARPFSGEYIFTGFNYRLKAGKRVEIKVYTDTEKNLRVSETDLRITGLVATGHRSTIPAVVTGLNAVSLKTIFNQVQTEMTLVDTGSIARGEKDNLMAGLKIKNSGGEDLKLASLIINTAGQGFSYSLGYSSLRAENRATGRRVGSRVTRPVAGANKINLRNYKLEVGEEVIFDIYIDASIDVPTRNFSLYFSDLEAFGYYSKIKATVAGDPTTGYNFNIAVASSFISPLEGNTTYGFHDPNYPFREFGEHSGIDIEVNQGTPVKAANSGIVAEAVDGGNNGYSYIIINHENNLSTVYGHLSRVDVSAGEEVSRGGIIGLSGGQIGAPGSGEYTTGPHLHFEIRLNGIAVDPLNYLD